MTKDLIDTIKKTKKWPFRLSDIFSRYFFLLFPIFIVFIGISEMYSGIKNDLMDLKFTATIIIGVGTFILYFITLRLYQNRRFDCYKIQNLTIDRIENAIKKTNIKEYKYYKTGYFECLTKVSAFSWGELITIIPFEETLLINSRPTGSLFSYQPITIFKDKKNIQVIVRELKNTSP